MNKKTHKKLLKEVQGIKLSQQTSMLLYLLYHGDIDQDNTQLKTFRNVGGEMYGLSIQGLTEYSEKEGDYAFPWSITLKGRLLIDHILSKH